MKQIKQAKLISQSAYARHRGVSQQHIQRLVKAGTLPSTDGKLDPAACDKILSNPRRIKVSAGDSTTSAALLQVRAQFEAARAQREELKLKAEQGQMVEVAEVERLIGITYANLNTRLRAIPSQLTREVFGETDRKKFQLKVSEFIRQVQNDLAEIADASADA